MPDVIVTDWNMPEMNGPQFVEAVRSQPALAKTPVLMVTTRAAKEDVIVALQAGVNDYLIKPSPMVEVMVASLVDVRRVAGNPRTSPDVH